MWKFIPQKFKDNPFIVWGFLLFSLAVLVVLFGRAEVAEVFRWAIGMEP